MSRRLSRYALRAWLLPALVLAAGSHAQAQTKTFTFDADFDGGTLANVQKKPAHQLVLGPTPVSKTTLVWATNYYPSFVVRIDTTTGKQTSRFDAALQFINGQPTGARPPLEDCGWGAPALGNCPGRVAVDTNGDVWIVNRAFGTQGSLSKFSGDLAHCIDRNDNGTIDTSFDANGDGQISVVAGAGEYFGQNDECILTTIPIGGTNAMPRGVAVDKKGKIWVSTWSDGKIYRYNPNEPVALETTVQVPGNPYSLATGGDWLFVSKSDGAGVSRVHIDTGAVETLTCGNTYGVVGDPGGNVAWFGHYFGGDGIYRADFAAGSCQYIATGGSVTAMTLDLQGNVWGANYANGTLHKLNAAGTIVGTYPAGGTMPHGLSVDFQGYVWVITHQPNISKIDPATGQIVGTYTLGGPGVSNADPYLYSDFTGVQVDRQAPYCRLGTWSASFDGGAAGIPWSHVAWNAEPQGAVPAETSLSVSVRAADSPAALGLASYALTASGAQLAGVVGRYVEVRAELKGPGYATSVLSDLTVTGPCNPVSDACCLSDADCGDGFACTIDTCPVPGGACKHAIAPSCCQFDGDCNDQNTCTVDTCPVPGGVCSFVATPGCCMSNADCLDADACTADICSGPGGTCSHVLVYGCCNTDADCNKGNLCSNATCPVPGGFCVGGAIPGCCEKDADCADVDLCTIDVCDVPTATCSNAKAVGCCNLDSECADADPCTVDACTGPGGICAFQVVAGCCTPDDPKIGEPCDLPVSPKDQPPCKAGVLACNGGKLECVGAVKPEIEICDHIDNDCDGVADSPPPCPVGTICKNGMCVEPCVGVEFDCGASLQCFEGYCMPTSCDLVLCKQGETCTGGLCYGPDAGPSGAGGSAPTGSSGTGAAASGGSGDAGQASLPPEATPQSGSPASSQEGGCGCEAPGSRGSPPAPALLAAAALALAASARRRRPARRAAS